MSPADFEFKAGNIPAYSGSMRGRWIVESHLSQFWNKGDFVPIVSEIAKVVEVVIKEHDLYYLVVGTESVRKATFSQEDIRRGYASF